MSLRRLKNRINEEKGSFLRFLNVAVGNEVTSLNIL